MGKIETEFLSAEKDNIGDILKQNKEVKKLISSKVFLDAIPNIYMILNSKRQIVYANHVIIEILGLKNEEYIYGLRLGDLLNCIHSDENHGGCGTTEFCRTCGAAQSIQQGLLGNIDSRECRIIRTEPNESLDLKVWSTPLSINNDNFLIFSVMDISHEKRRKALEKIFFHDIMNTAGSLKGWLQMLNDSQADEIDMIKRILNSITNDIIDEINAQKILLNAENNDLIVEFSDIDSLDLIAILFEQYKKHPVSEDKILQLDSVSESIRFRSDVVLIRRVIGNLVKNALEASNVGNTVTIGCNQKNGSVEFWVHNQEFIERDIQLQIFQRSFSTKGVGRGLGTYSIRLLTERYLNGKVSFSSDEKYGTTFVASYPIKIDK